MPVIGLNHHATEAELKAEADEIWQHYWVEDLTRNGDVDLELVKGALAGYTHLREIVGVVYDDLSGGRISKPGYNDTGQIIGVIRESFEEQAQDYMIDALKSSLPDSFHAPGTNWSELRGYIEAVCQGLSIDPASVLAP